MSDTTLTSKGQTTIPKDIRDGLGLKPGDKLSFTLLSDGTIILRAKTRKILDCAGFLSSPKQTTVAVEKMSPWE
jgi:antitoxin PrlF